MNIKKAIAAAGLGLTLTAASVGANAFSLGSFQGPVEIKFSGYTVGDASATPGSGMESTWGAGFVTQINEFGNPTNILWQTSGSETMSYMIYGIADAAVVPSGPRFDIFNVGCTVGTGCDGKIHIDFYLNPTGGSFADTTPAGISTSDRTGFSSMSQITDGTLLMSWVMVPGIVTGDPTTVLFQDVTGATLPATGSGRFYADCVVGVGPANGPCKNPGHGFDQDSQGGAIGADFFGQFTLTTTSGGIASNGWEGSTFDPILTSVPEPGMLALLGAGLLGFAGMRRRRH